LKKVTGVIEHPGRPDPAVVAIEAQHAVQNFFLLLSKIRLFQAEPGAHPVNRSRFNKKTKSFLRTYEQNLLWQNTFLCLSTQVHLFMTDTTMMLTTTPRRRQGNMHKLACLHALFWQKNNY
jgi:hypothetical protein